MVKNNHKYFCFGTRILPFASNYDMQDRRKEQCWSEKDHGV